MREIKFRAWNKSSNKMYKDILVNGKFVAQKYIDMSGNHNIRDLDNPNDAYSYYIPLQYTGLKDKNGVETYEGDIIRFLDNEGIDSICTVVFKDGGFYPFAPDYLHWSIIEVIGNIYENPELLENK